MEFLDADYTFVDERLAKLYGIPGVTGDEFRKVQVDKTRRGGIFTQASFLTLTSKPLGKSRRTSPVMRGKWILENIFNQTIPPPPPNVPSLELRPEQGAEGHGPADLRAAPRRIRRARAAMRGWIRTGSRWRTTTATARGASRTIASTWTRRARSTARAFTTPSEFRAMLADRQGRLPARLRQEDVELRARPRHARLRQAGDGGDWRSRSARTATRCSSVVVERREELSVQPRARPQRAKRRRRYPMRHRRCFIRYSSRLPVDPNAPGRGGRGRGRGQGAAAGRGRGTPRRAAPVTPQ